MPSVGCRPLPLPLADSSSEGLENHHQGGFNPTALVQLMTASRSQNKCLHCGQTTARKPASPPCSFVTGGKGVGGGGEERRRLSQRQGLPKAWYPKFPRGDPHLPSPPPRPGAGPSALSPCASQRGVVPAGTHTSLPLPE